MSTATRTRFLPDLSLKRRLVLGMIALVVPLMVIGTLGYVLYKNTLDTLERSYEELQYELIPLERLRSLVLQAQMPGNDYLIHGNVAERTRFSALQMEGDTAFRAALATPFDQPEKHVAVRAAEQLWTEGVQLSERILALEDPIGDATGAELMEAMDAAFTAAHDRLEQATALGIAELSRQHQMAHTIHAQVWILIATIATATAMVVLFGVKLLQGWIVAPLATLKDGAERLGTGDLSHRIPIHTDDEIGRVAAAFNQMADSLLHDRNALVEMATHDQLTGLLNVREFHRAYDLEISRSQRHRHVFSILMLDLDFFKAVNDRHGHLAGDEVLREIATRITASMRPTDSAARYGGEEFIVILPETDTAGAAVIAERLRMSIAAAPINVMETQRLSITVSIGVATFPLHAQTGQSLIAAADAALYAAKAGGRNRVQVHEQAIAAPA